MGVAGRLSGSESAPVHVGHPLGFVPEASLENLVCSCEGQVWKWSRCPRNKCLLISWLQLPSAVILEPPKIKPVTVSIVSPSICHEAFHFHALEKEMATHSSTLAWGIPRMAEPGGLPSMGSHRVGHD